jgi:3-methyladenine DNA glycosylase/8-oxoguanine DNA glycosylase
MGPWTVRGCLMIALDGPDAFPSGDPALRRTTMPVCVLAQPPTEQELLDIGERRRPYRGLAEGYHFLSEFEAKP